MTGKPLHIESGPNWDDDLGGSTLYARNDPNRQNLPDEVKASLDEVDRVVFNYMPRICNHCLNPACVAACPSGAIYKRAEDGIVLVNENQCRAWRMYVAACPYKKVYYNWNTGKSEKCILCFPRMETGQTPACAHSCVGRIRYMGVLLYDADRILRKMYAVRLYMRRKTVDKNVDEATLQTLTEAGCGPEQAEAIYKLTTLPTVPERFVLPPYHREMSIEALKDPLAHKGEVGIGYIQPPKRGD